MSTPPPATTDPVLVFLHVPKTAGATLHRVIARQARGRQVVTLRLLGEPPDAIAEHLAGAGDVDVVKGHVYFGVHRHVRRPVHYITVLRHPVARVWSLYRYIRTEPRHPLHPQVRDMSLPAFLDSDLDHDQVRDGQVRQLVGAPGRDLGADDLALARDRLEHELVGFGLQEQFDASLVLLRRTLGWNLPPFYVSRNVTRGPREPLSEEDRRRIEDHNRLDLELHAAAEAIFARRRAQERWFEAELAVFRRLNRGASALAGLRR